MTVRILFAPAAAGKTAHVLKRAREAARDLQSLPRVVVSTHLQVRAFRRRLAQAGGAIGVRVLTFDKLYAECLSAAGESYTELSEPVRYRLIRAVIDDLPLAHYGPLREYPGFVRVLQQLIAELKAARVYPETFSAAIAGLGNELRLAELAQVYAAYQARLRTQGWADRAGLGWLAVEALEERAPNVGRDWPLLMVDGFDSFTSVQLALLGLLSERAGETIITLTGDGGRQRSFVHRRFLDTRRRLEAALAVPAAPLVAAEGAPRHAPALAHLEARLFEAGTDSVESGGAVSLVEAPDRAAEVRAALRWLKARLVQDGLRPGEVALLARAISPYRAFILETAAEFGLPARLVDGLPLKSNPAVAALLDLLRLMLPLDGGGAEPALPRRLVVEAWQSPYFDWSARPAEDVAEPIGIEAGDAEKLDAVARWGRVIGGRHQWDEALDALVGRGPEAEADEERGFPARVPVGAGARGLRARFHRFVARLTPPASAATFRDFVGWLERIIGPDPDQEEPEKRGRAEPGEPTALQVVGRVRNSGDEALAERDLAALRALKDLLRGLVWAEEALGAAGRIRFSDFFDELAGGVEAASYRLPFRPEREEILVADVVQARGVPFRAVAVLGLAEGEFPAALKEDPFLRDADRRALRETRGLELEPSTESREAEYFYETVTRPCDRLLLTRPRLADNGAPWQASPFWEEVRRRVSVPDPAALTTEGPPPPDQAASWPELMTLLAARPDDRDLACWVQQENPARLVALGEAAALFDLRSDSAARSPLEGDLSHRAAHFADRFAPRHVWSASRLESYRTCPFFFFVGSVLNLEPREEPAEGLDARQLGNIYHHIFEALHQAPEVTDPGDLAQLLAALEAAAGRVLDAASRREGFRETAWWDQTRAEIVANVGRSLEALAALPGNYAPYQHEVVFGLEGQPPLIVSDGEDSFRMRGYIDRVDRAPDGRVRVIDYKTGGPSAFNKSAIVEGKKLQLPLYALAARDALALGEPVEGFYWHVRHAEPSGFSLSRFDGGPEGAMATAVENAWEAVRGARGGHFVPEPTAGSCPSYCPAAAFCWRYRAGFGG